MTEKTVEQTIALIEKGLEDIQKNKATKAEVLDLIKQRTEIDQAALKAAQDKLSVLEVTVSEQKTVATELQSKMRQFRANNYDALKGPGGSYRGLFSSPAEAKAFGLMVMAACTAGNPKVAEKHQMAMKALEGFGATLTHLNEKGVKTMTGAATTGGSALINPDYVPTLISLFEQYSKFEGNAQKVPLGSSGGLAPVDLGEDDDMGGIYCPGEGGLITMSDPKIGTLSHVLKTLCKLTAYSLELDEDSALELGEALGRIFVRCYSKAIDYLAFRGSGQAANFGILGITSALLKVDANIANIKSLIVGSGNAYSELVLADFTKCVGILPDYADDGDAKWYMHRYFYYTVYVALALAAGGASASEVILGAGQRQKLAASYPVEFTQVMPSVAANSQVCALFANLMAGCQMGRRGILEIAQSTERFFDQGMVAVRGRRRISINAHGVGNTVKPGPIIGLITAAA